MSSWLIVVDMQVDFVRGSLGSEEAEKIIPEKPCESRRSECSRRREPFWYPSG